MNEDTGYRMSDFISKAEAFLNRIETQNELQKQQLEMYKERQERNEAMLERQFDLHESRWKGIRQMVIGVSGVMLMFLVSSSVALKSRPTEEEVQERLNNYPTKVETLRGFGSVIDDVYDATITDMESKEKANELSNEAKENVLNEILPDYKTRSVKRE